MYLIQFTRTTRTVHSCQFIIRYHNEIFSPHHKAVDSLA